MTNARRRTLFRVLAVGLPCLGGLLVILTILVRQGWIQRDDQGQWTWSRPPLYLQEPGFERTGHRYLYDATLGWRNIPSWEASTFGNPLSINAQGFRGPAVTRSKPAQTKRILVLGDSYAWGYGVADEETFSAVLDRSLRGESSPWQVLNSGVSGWGTDQQLLFLREEGLGYEPDVVVLAFFLGNDIDNNHAATQYMMHKPVFVDLELTLANVPVPRPGYTVEPRVLRQLVAVDAMQLTLRILAGIRDACASQDIPFVLMKFGRFLAPELPYAKRLDQQLAEGIQMFSPPVRYLDLDQVFAEESLTMTQLTAGVDDGHWNAFGHQAVARALADFLRAEGILAANASQPARVMPPSNSGE